MNPSARSLAALLDSGDAVPKRYTSGTHRDRAPEETVARVRGLLPALGITRIANVTGLDRIGVPVVMVCRPNSRSLAVAQGKGLTLAAARASGLMESIEAYHAERVHLPLRLGSCEELRYTHRLVDVERLPLALESRFDPRLPLLWVEGEDLVQEERVWLPLELVHGDLTLPGHPGRGAFPLSSNGLASGNHPLEALSHALCEVVERDAMTLWWLLDDEARERTRLDLGSVGSAEVEQLLERLERAGVAVAAFEVTSDVGIPAFACWVVDRDGRAAVTSAPARGSGCHPAREIALLRALTEAIQGRLTCIAGARDDLEPGIYEVQRGDAALDSLRELVTRGGGRRRFADAATFESETIDDDVRWEIEHVRATGCDAIVVVDLTRPDFALPVVRVVVPGLESDTEYAAPGARAARSAARGAPGRS